MKQIRNYFLSFLVIQLLITSCTSSSSFNRNTQIRRQCYQQTINGCRSIKHIILGLDIEYEFTNLRVAHDSLSGTLIYVGERLNPENGRWGRLAYSNPLRIYTLDTMTCKHKYIGNSDKQGLFKVRVDNGDVVAFSNIDIDSCCSYLDCIIIGHK